MRSRLVGDTRWAAAGLATGIVGSVAFNATVTRIADKDAVGIYFLSFSVVAFGATFGRAGLNVSALRLIAEAMERGRPRWALGVDRQTRSLSAIISIGASLVVALILYAWGPTLFGSTDLRAGAYLVGIWTFFEATRIVLGDILRGYDDIRWGVACNQVLRPTFAVVAAATLLVSNLDVGALHLLALAGGASAFATVVAYTALLIRWRQWDIAPAAISGRRLLRIGLPLMVTQLMLSVVAQGDIWIVGAFRPSDEVAGYGAAVQTARFVVLPLLLVNTVLSPQIARLQSRGDRKRLERMVRLASTAVGYPVIVGMAVLAFVAEPMFGLVYGQAYRDAATLFLILAVGQAASVAMGSNGLVLSMTGNERLLMTITAVTAILTLGISAFAANQWGATGVAIVSSTGTATNNVALVIMTRRRLGIWTHALTPRRAWLALSPRGTDG